MAAVHLFHYHLVTSAVRDVEARYVGRLGFRLVARYGRVGDRDVTVAPGASWEALDRDGFSLRLSELQRGAVNVVVQPGRWRIPRVDHVGVALAEDDFQAVLGRATRWCLPVQERAGRQALVSTNAGYRLEVHPPRDWLDDLLAERGRFRLRELQLRADRPERQAAALADLLGAGLRGATVAVGDAAVRFLAGGPEGRPELYAERFA